MKEAYSYRVDLWNLEFKDNFFMNFEIPLVFEGKLFYLTIFYDFLFYIAITFRKRAFLVFFVFFVDTLQKRNFCTFYVVDNIYSDY